jgi:phage regulator Rha-like protein
MTPTFIIPDEILISKIYFLRDKKIMLAEDLAEMYGVETKRLNEQVKRNLDRFPEDFMFQLTHEEHETLRSQFATSNRGGRRYEPYAFTEHGILMLSSVLNSKKAITINIQLMRIFTKMREILLTHKDLLLDMENIRKKVNGQDEKIEMIYNYLIQFVKQKEESIDPIGFRINGK